MNRRVAAVVSAWFCAAIALAPLSASADVSEAGAISAGLLEPANASLQRALNDLKSSPGPAPRDVAQSNPIGTPQAPIRRPSLPQGFTYNVDFSMGFPVGDLGFNAGDPGGMDAGFGLSFSRTNRLQVGYYEIQQVPLGFSNANVPLYLQGYTGPGTTLPGASLGRTNTGVVDVTTKDKIFEVSDQNLFVLGGKLPIVISPSYIAHTATIGGHEDVALAEFDGYPSEVRLRTEQEYLLPVTLPFLATPRMFGTLTFAAQWLVHPAGFNQTNHAQLFSLLYLEYRASKKTTFFIQPSRLVQYDPVDPYPMYEPSIIYGIAHHFTPQTFIQVLGIEGYPSNYRQLGIESLTCQRLPCSSNLVAPQFGGLHAAEFQIQLGIGSPTVVPL